MPAVKLNANSRCFGASQNCVRATGISRNKNVGGGGCGCMVGVVEGRERNIMETVFYILSFLVSSVFYILIFLYPQLDTSTLFINSDSWLYVRIVVGSLSLSPLIPQYPSHCTIWTPAE